MVRNAHLARKEAAVSCGIILVPVSVARSMGLTVYWGVLRWVLSSRDGDRRLLGEVVVELGKNEGCGWMFMASLAQRFVECSRQVAERREVRVGMPHQNALGMTGGALPTITHVDVELVGAYAQQICRRYSLTVYCKENPRQIRRAPKASTV